jgi:hypothetical protein
MLDENGMEVFARRAWRELRAADGLPAGAP